MGLAHRGALPRDLALAAVARHRENHARGPDACLQWGPRSSVSRVALATQAGAVELAVKWSRWRGLRGALSDRLRGSRAARALRGAERLARAGLPAAEPLAAVERRRLGLPVESFLVTRFVAGAEPLPEATRGAPPRERRALARALGAFVGALHAAGVHHPDLKHKNLLVGPGARLTLVDLDPLVPRRRMTWRRRVRALAQLEAYARRLYPDLPRSARARFLRAYLARNPALLPGRLVAAVGRVVEKADTPGPVDSGRKRSPRSKPSS